MDKSIPIYFDTVILDSPIQQISVEDSNVNRLQVAVFTKYKNRNGSYITDEYADFLIKSATRGNCPVVGFFDPESQEWAGHTGPLLANGYGYVENFIGWEPMVDTDGTTRDYAVFSVVLFTDYYEEAQKIRGQHQSMELDIKTITGDWADFEGEEYYVYKTGNMLGLCIIGQHEPCFSVSSFFSKDDDNYKSQYEKFSSLLFGLKTQVEEAEKNKKGGEQKMEEFEKTPEVEAPAKENPEEDFSKKEEEETPGKESQPSEFEVLQQKFEELQNSYNELKDNFSAAETKITELEDFQVKANEELEELRSQNSEFKKTISDYEAAEKQVIEEKKNSLIERYEKFLTEEEINPIKTMTNDFSYDELESKLAIVFANKQIAGSDKQEKVPLPEPEQSQFALLMQKYRKK